MSPLIVLGILSFLTAIIALGHWFILRGLIAFWDIRNARSLFAARVILTVLALSFVGVSMLASVGWSPFIRVLYAASAIWLGTALWLCIAALIGLVILIAVHRTTHAGKARVFGKTLMILAILVSAYGVWHSYDTRVTRYDISLPDLPAAWEGKTLALVADTHLGNVRNVAFSEHVAALVAAQKPDALLIAGDFFDGPPANFTELAAPFGKLQLPHGVLFANGNHEEFSESGTYDEALSKAGVTVLVDRAVVIDGLQFAGVNYSSSNSSERVATTLADMRLNTFLPTVLIKHVPDGIDAIAAAGVDLMVSGHTHGGQVLPGPWIVARIYQGVSYGLNSRGGLQVLTTSGAGTWGPPQRIGSNPEIVLFTLRAAPTAP